MTLDEAKSFITYLKNRDEGISYVKRIFHLAYLSDIIYGDTEEDKAMNTAKLNSFLEQRGTVKKPLSKEFLSQFKTAEDVDNFLKKLHAKVYEGMLEGEMKNHLVYEKNAPEGKNSGNSRNGSYPKTIQTEYGEYIIDVFNTDVFNAFSLLLCMDFDLIFIFL